MAEKKHSPITFEERLIIERMAREGCPLRQIAIHLGRSPSVIGYEIQTNSSHEGYIAEEAQKFCDGRKRRIISRPPLSIYKEKIPLMKEDHARGFTSHQMRIKYGIPLRALRKLKNNGFMIEDTHSLSPLLSDVTCRIEILEDQIKILSETLKEFLCQK